MLKLYFLSVIVWILILRATAVLCKDMMEKNGWRKTREDAEKSLFAVMLRTVALSCVPIFRAVAVFVYFYAAMHEKDEEE